MRRLRRVVEVPLGELLLLAGLVLVVLGELFGVALLGRRLVTEGEVLRGLMLLLV